MGTKLEGIVDDIQASIEKATYDRYFHLYEIALNFLKKEDILLYGGTAINSIIPKKDKFYGQFELPDIDLFCTNAQSLAKRLVKVYKDKSTPTNVYVASVRSALHEGTWKVMVNGAPIADLSQMDKVSYETIKQGSILGDLGLRVPNQEYLRMTLYAIMSQPIDSHRWLKVYDRLSIFNRLFPVKLITKAKDKDAGEIKSSHNKAQAAIIYNFIKSVPYVVIAYEATDYPLILVDAKHMDKVRTEIAKAFATGKEKVKVEAVVKEDSFLQEHFCVSNADGERVMIVFSTNNVCLNYVKTHKVNVATTYTTLRMLYAMFFSDHETLPKATLAKLIKAFEKLPLRNQFSMTCYGHQPSVFTLRKQQFLRK